MYLSKEQIIRFLPHRDPFLFLDSIESIRKEGRELSPGDITTNQDLVGIEVISNFMVLKELDLFRGHFPNNPILPGVIQIEMMAQCACFTIAVRESDPFNLDLKVAFMGITKAKFRKAIIPEMPLRIVCKSQKCRGGSRNLIMSYDGKIYYEDTVMSECSLLASVNY